MKKFLNVFFAFFIMTALLMVGFAFRVTQAASASLASTSRIVKVNAELNRYINRKYGFSVTFPRQVLADSVMNPHSTNPTVSVTVVEKGEAIIFTRDYNLDPTHTNSAGNFWKVLEDLTLRTPYYSSDDLNDPSYPYQIYAASVHNVKQLQDFVQRTYGKGCKLSSPSDYADKPNQKMFALESADSAAKNCPSYYPVGDVVVWNTKKQVAVGYQPGCNGNFTKPYTVSPSQNAHYDLKVTWL